MAMTRSLTSGSRFFTLSALSSTTLNFTARSGEKPQPRLTRGPSSSMCHPRIHGPGFVLLCSEVLKPISASSITAIENESPIGQEPRCAWSSSTGSQAAGLPRLQSRLAPGASALGFTLGLGLSSVGLGFSLGLGSLGFSLHLG